MKKKHAPQQYAARAKMVALKSSPLPFMHQALGVAKLLVSWMERGGVPPSVILLHGLHLARSPENDGLPVDTYRRLKMQGTDNKVISEIMDALARPQADKTRIIAEWLRSVWVKKSATTPHISLPKKERKKSSVPGEPVTPSRKAKGPSLKKPIIQLKKSRKKPS
jgi:hypothetical protein